MPRHQRAKWTIMVYLAGDNNLTSFCINVLQQLEAITSDDICVLACFDSNTPWPKGSRYLEINCQRNNGEKVLNWEIHNDLIVPHRRGHSENTPDFCDLNPDPPKRKNLRSRPVVAEGLKRFINWTMRRHGNSERLMLILFGHGPVVAGQTFLAQENPPSSVRFQDLKDVLGRHFGPGHRRKLDLLVCQNCVMNGIETAFEVKPYVKYMIGSQGLVLATGWPYDKLIGAVAQNPDADTATIGSEMLKVCARNLLDFSIMDRSSEQALVDLSELDQPIRPPEAAPDGVDNVPVSKLDTPANITIAIRNLVRELNQCLKFKGTGDKQVVRYAAIRDAVKLARLEAQSYWGENFVDLYDFCERLLKQCRNIANLNASILEQMKLATPGNNLQRKFRTTGLGKKLVNIIKCCIAIMKLIDQIVLESYYIGSELQYSHGFSIYFPWTLPMEPYSFIRMSQGRDYWLEPAFQSYCGYKYVQDSRWGRFLLDFFRATLRNVRRAKQEFSLKTTATMPLGLSENIEAPAEVLTSLQNKSSPDHGITDYTVWSNVKNYPRRNYLSPPDCARKIYGAKSRRPGEEDFRNPTSPPVSYLGWNMTGIVAEVVKFRSRRRVMKSSK